jgi:hypothetical protein
MNSPLIEMLAEILERGRKDGSFRGGVDPLQLYVSIAGLSYFYLSNSHTLSAIFGRDLLSAKAKNERLTHMCDVDPGLRAEELKPRRRRGLCASATLSIIHR